MELIKFYKKILESLKLVVTENGFIKSDSSDTAILITTDDGKPLVLPYKEHIDNMITIEDGKPTTTKVLFNPLREDAIKGEPISLKKYKSILEIRVGYSLALLIELIITILADEDLLKKAPISINNLFADISNDVSTSVKKIVDDKTLTNWQKVYSNSLSTRNSILHIYLKKGGSYNGKKYNRLAVTNFGILDLLNDLNKRQVHGVNLRKKDMIVLSHIHRFIFETDIIYIGSNDKMAAGLHSILLTLLKISDRINKLLKVLKYASEDLPDEAMIDVKYNKDDLTDWNKYSPELARIPSDVDMYRKTKKNKKNKGVEEMNKKTDSSSVFDRILGRRARNIQPTETIQRPDISQSFDNTTQTVSNKSNVYDKILKKDNPRFW